MLIVPYILQTQTLGVGMVLIVPYILQTQTWGLDLWDQLDLRRDLFGNYSTYLFRDRAQNIIRQHDKSKVTFSGPRQYFKLAHRIRNHLY